MSVHFARKDRGQTCLPMGQRLGMGNPSVFGLPNNPQAYAFHFLESSDRPIEYPSYIYSELYLYKQICKGYSWFGVEDSIAWVRETRQHISQILNHGMSGSQEHSAIAAENQGTPVSNIQVDAIAETLSNMVVEAEHSQPVETQRDPDAGEPNVGTPSDRNIEARGGTFPNEIVTPIFPTHTDPALQAAAQALFALCSPFEVDAEAQATTDGDADREGPDRCPSHDYDPDTDPILPPAFPMLAGEYTVVKCGVIKVVAFELFGIILNREDAIRCALQEWLPFIPRTWSLDATVRRYVHCEAFAERDLAFDNEFALDTIVQGGLQALAEQLHINPSERDHLISTALATILAPHPYPDASDTLTELKQRGYSLVCIPPHSPSETLEHARRVLPPGTLDGVRVFPRPSCVHFSSLTRGPSFASIVEVFCSEGVATAGDVADTTSQTDGDLDNPINPNDSDKKPKLLQRNEILVATAGMGRIVVGAQESGFATCLVERADCRESLVSFVLGGGAYRHPVPSLIVEGLAPLCAALAKEAELFAASQASGVNAAGAGERTEVPGGGTEE
ncbi:hypothetical protein C8Q73DRAFT_204394 [Cubamyces lactineus]|nr:hypothetical protein C8Q73DRAFT_204394 [Cubamyces lactineus]